MTTPPITQTTADSDRVTVFDTYRHLLFGVAYRLLGEVADAEDVVQEAWLRWARVEPTEVENPRAFLVRVATRLALDRLRRLKTQREREEYVGPWLPEPLLTSPDVAEETELAETVSLALLLLLQTLSPLERAVFVLHEVFGFAFTEVAEMLGRNEAAVRQVAHRARAHVDARRPRFDPDPAVRQRVTEQFLAACASGKVETLMGVLAPEVTLLADSGGLTRAPRQPIYGADRVARFLLGIWPQLPADMQTHLAQLNGSPAVVGTVAGQPIGAVVLEVVAGLVQRAYFVVNPHKLRGLTGFGTPPVPAPEPESGTPA